MPSQDDRDFHIGNLPEGLNVIASEGAPSYLKTRSLELKQDINQFGLAGKIWQRCARVCHARWNRTCFFKPAY